ncbi:putative late blight resistance protein homolog R1A-10 [Salvia hispanica]|uniref:putative late blight resistance protein homolog R1A-10 n=1 Tax=Salvia hispanica TaxID=49212 RepID=UPI002008F4BF|nr:putative late blight resistance protein homolog R1A-10 [Salvia hispanica]
MCRLEKVLLKLDETGYSKIRTKVNALDERIKEVVWEFEDLLESHYADQILPQLESERDGSSFLVDMQSLQQSVDCFIERVMVMEAEYDVELLNMPEEEGEPLSSRIDFSGINSNMVGLSDEFERVREYLLLGGICFLLTGMAGVGKTTLAKKVFDDPSIQTHFELRALVKVGRKCKSNETLQCILAQLDPNNRDQMLIQRDDDDIENLVGLLEDRLKDKKCLIVLDDVWQWDTRLTSTLQEKNVQFLVTSRLRIEDSPVVIGVVRLLGKEESKRLLGEKVFGEKGFPPYLEELGEKIAQKCEGLPLMIVTVAELLTKDNKCIAEELLNKEELNKSIQEYWTEVAEKQQSSVFLDAYNQISKVFFPSYDYLPQILKMPFLYLGAFPPYRNIRAHDLIWCVSAEGFCGQFGKEKLDEVMDGLSTMEYFVFGILRELSHNYHLLLYDFDTIYWFSNKRCRVHSCWQHLCKKEASRIKFLHVLQSCDEVMEGQRRLCAHSNTLFAIKEVYDSIKSDCSSTVRSLLCLGPDHPYPVPIHAMDFKLLRVLKTRNVRFFDMPPEILKLVCLKYLALTCNKELPASISTLLHLQILIIHRHVAIIKRGALSYMPMEIWDMQNLQYLDVMGRDMPTPNSNSNAILDRVSFLIGVTTKSCSTEILKRIPNLRRLSMIMMQKPYDEDDDCNLLSGLANISEELQNLKVLSIDVLNPDMKWETMLPLSMFPSNLLSLALSGLGYPWQYMNDIGSMLPNLGVLRLEDYAFRGPVWDIESSCFLKLQNLVIEDTDLVELRSLPWLKLLSLRHCYKLKHLDWLSGNTRETPVIELVDCNPLVYASAEEKLSEYRFEIRSYRSYL